MDGATGRSGAAWPAPGQSGWVPQFWNLPAATHRIEMPSYSLTVKSFAMQQSPNHWKTLPLPALGWISRDVSMMPPPGLPPLCPLNTRI